MILIAACFVLGQSRRVVLDAVGDVMLGRYVGRRIEREGDKSPFDAVRKELENADLSVGNLECVISERSYVGGKRFQLRAKPTVIGCLRHSGLTMLSLANNHAGDCGLAGIADTQRFLKRAGIIPLGPEPEPMILKRNGIKIGFLPLLDISSQWIYRISVLTGILSEMRKKCDILVVMLHWGIEGSLAETESQWLLAKELAVGGVDLILGSHPHVLQPVRWVSGRDGHRCLCCYSLGNFVFDAPNGKQRESMVLSVEVGPSGVLSYRELPVKIEHGYPVLR